MLAIDPETADHVRLMYEMYADPQISLGDISRHFSEKGISFGKDGLTRHALSYLLRNPAYAQADLDLYEFFKAQGAAIANDAADFAGLNGCYLFQGRDATERKVANLKDHILVVAPHEGLITSKLWLQCRRKLNGNSDFGGTSKKAKNTWLAGKIKCGKCGAGLMFAPNPSNTPYFRCRKRADSKSCEGCGTIRVREFEQAVYEEMRRKMAEFQTLTGGNPVKATPKLTALYIEQAQIEKLLDTLVGANTTLLNYANSKIEELDAKRQSLTKAIADMSADSVSPERIKRISGYLDNWDNISFEDRRLVVDGMISVIHATSEDAKISWKI